MRSPERFPSFEKPESSKGETEQKDRERANYKSFENGVFWLLAMRAKEELDKMARKKGRISPEDQEEVFKEVASRLQEITREKHEEFEKRYGVPPRATPLDVGFELKERVIPSISLGAETFLDFGGPTGKIKNPSRETYFEAIRNYLKKTKDEPETHSLIQTHAEGFARAALQEGDIDTAVRGFVVGGQIEKPEIREMIENILERMSNSDKEEERERAERARKYLTEHFEKK